MFSFHPKYLEKFHNFIVISLCKLSEGRANFDRLFSLRLFRMRRRKLTRKRMPNYWGKTHRKMSHLTGSCIYLLIFKSASSQNNTPRKISGEKYLVNWKTERGHVFDLSSMVPRRSPSPWGRTKPVLEIWKGQNTCPSSFIIPR